MTGKPVLAFVVAALLAGAASGHSGVKNAAVKARMAAMSEIGAATKVLGQMAKGETAFDAAAAQSAAQAIARVSQNVPNLFVDAASDPKSEALPSIWQNYPDFVAKAADMQSVSASVSITDEGSLKQVLGQIGATCKACHALYRE